MMDNDLENKSTSNGNEMHKFSTELSLEDVRKMQDDFAKERDWDQFHTPRNLLFDLASEVGELAELFRWKCDTKVGLPGWSNEEKTHAGQELSDVLMTIIRLAEKCHVDLPVVVIEKIELNKKKYPAHMVRGLSKKYTEYEGTRQTEMSNTNDVAKENIDNGCELHKFSNSLSLEDIRKIQAHFCRERDWDQFHSPRNVLLALVGEVGELAELFQWKGEVEAGLPGWSDGDKTNVSHELSDVLIYLIRLADRCHVDLPVAVLKKFEHNSEKYPANIVRGQCKKYTEYQINGEPALKKHKES